jgi:hypothetical protein
MRQLDAMLPMFPVVRLSGVIQELMLPVGTVRMEDTK